MLSIFNIIDLLVSNANNNNNRNNINDNAQNVNDNSNTESNTNPGQSSANQVMMVPPGAGRRIRDLFGITEDSPAAYLGYEIQNKRTFNSTSDNKTFKIHLSPLINNITSSWYNLHVEKASEIKSEVLLGINMASNAWFLLENLDPDDKCHIMNICELGFNGSVWGEMSELVTEFSGLMFSRWISNENEHEQYLVSGLRLGMELGEKFKKGTDDLQCSNFYSDVCSIAHWNEFVTNTKRNFD